MKNLIALFTFLFAIAFVQAQNFQDTEKYRIADHAVDKETDTLQQEVFLIKDSDHEEKLATFTVEDPYLYDGAYVTVLENPGLEGVKEVIKVELGYSACCTSVYTHFLLVTEDDNLIQLPVLENVFCDTGEAEVMYLFPSQPFGQTGKIVVGDVYYDENYEVTRMEVAETFQWLDDAFDTQDGLAQTTKF